MTATDIRTRFTGVFGFPITPFRKDLSLDLDALERNVAGNLEDGQIVVFEPVVEVGFRQHDKDRDQSDAGKEIGRRNNDRDGAGVAIDQQHRADEHVADALHGQHMAALADPALQYFQRQSGRHGRTVGALPLKQ